jgi:hypothetical protein
MLSLVIDGFLLFYASPALTHQFDLTSRSRHLGPVTCSPCAACTFLGPSRKRGPPKGYIDAIEARLHQTEALLGVLLAVEADHDERCVQVILHFPILAESVQGRGGSSRKGQHRRVG